MGSFVKVDTGIVDSSIWSEPPATRVVWLTMLATSDQHGFVATSYGGLWRNSNVERVEFDAAIKTLEGPDMDSRSPEHEGRRIEKIEGGWMILNYSKYRKFSYSGTKDAERKRLYREQKIKDLEEKDGTNVGHVPNVPGHSASASVVSSSVVNKPTSKKVVLDKPEWYGSFEIYRVMVLSAVKELLKDEKWVSQREEFIQNIDVRQSLKKAFVDFWGVEAGWRHKKKGVRVGSNGKYPEIDWKKTFSNALDQKMNRVYLPRDGGGSAPYHNPVKND